MKLGSAVSNSGASAGESPRAEGRDRFKVVIAGGGVAGLEALLALRDLAGELLDITLLAPETEFVYRPMAVGEPFGRGSAAHHPVADIASEFDVELIGSALVEVDSARRVAVTQAGQRIGYDALVVAVGARSEPALRRALTWTPEIDAGLFGGLLRDLDEGYVKRVAFVVPPGVAWALPAYELAMMTAWQASGMGHDDVEVTIYTPEDAPLGMFGTRATAAVRDDLEEAGVRVETGVYVSEDPREPGRLVLQPGERALDVDRVVALPRAVGPAVGGVPSDARGFVLTDLHGKVAGIDGVWAAGDAIAFPVKQGGLAAQQAGAAAEAIAAIVRDDVQPQPFAPVLRGMMLTGRGNAWMRHGPGTAEPGTVERRALWWPPTKIAGRYLSPYLAAREGSDPVGDGMQPNGQLVDLDLEHEVPAVVDAMRQAKRRGECERARSRQPDVGAPSVAASS